MAAGKNSFSIASILRGIWQDPRRVSLLLVGYVVIIVLILLSLNRGNTWFPLHTMLAFPLLAFSPFLIINSPLPGWSKAIGLALLLGILIPLIGIYDSNYLELMIQIMIFSALALGLNIVVGFAGLLDLGYIAFFAIGAYLWAMFTSESGTWFDVNNALVPTSGFVTIPGINVTVPVQAFYIFVIIGAVVTAISGILLGLPVLRLRGDYLAIVTLGFGEMIRVLVNNLNQPANLTNGPQGLHGVAAPGAAFLIDPINGIANNILQIKLLTPAPLAQQMLFYFMAIVVVGLVILMAIRLDNSPIGRAWTAIREDEVAAIAMGVPLVRMKLLAFATGAACAGAIGVLYGAKQTFINPESFTLLQSINILAMVIVGGMGGIKGAIFGAVIVTLLNLHVLKQFGLLINSLSNAKYVIPIINFPVENWPDQLRPEKYERFIFGILLVVMMIFRPEGLMPSERRKMELHREEMTKEPTDIPDLEKRKREDDFSPGS